MTYEELIAQRAEIDAQIAAAVAGERKEALTVTRELVAKFQFTARELFVTTKAKPSGDKRASVAPKYRDPATGQTWSGRGFKPTWVKGNEAAFLIA